MTGRAQVGHGEARLGAARNGRHVAARLARSCIGSARCARPRYGTARQQCIGVTRSAVARLGAAGMQRRGLEGLATPSHGLPYHGTAGTARRASLWHGTARLAMARQAS